MKLLCVFDLNSSIEHYATAAERVMNFYTCRGRIMVNDWISHYIQIYKDYD